MNTAIKPIVQHIEKKSGIKTTEFWLTLGMNVAAVLATVSEVLPPKWAMMFATVSNGIYAISRGVSKFK